MKTKGESVGIKPRNIKHDFKDVDVATYYNYDFFLTSFWNVLSATFPPGETFFVDSVKNYRHLVSDDVLKAQVSGFIGQESFHTREHMSLNSKITFESYDVLSIERQVETLLKLARKLPKKHQLAITVALEHYTAIIAQQLLEDDSHRILITDEVMKDFWTYHATEEVGHATVAFDVFKNVAKGSELLRKYVMIVASVALFSIIAFYMTKILVSKRRFFHTDTFFGTIFLFNLFSPLKDQWLDYFKNGFHPSDHTNVELLKKWEAKLDNLN